MDIIHNQVYCFSCGDYVYDRDFDKIIATQKTNAISLSRFVNGYKSSSISQS